eukprot:1988798-Amphidinium_carterae.1
MGALPSITINPRMSNTLSIMTPQEAIINKCLQRQSARDINSLNPGINMQQSNENREHAALKDTIGSLQG